MNGARKKRKKKVRQQKIAAASPTWEEYQAAKAKYDAAMSEHRSLLGLQARLNQHRQGPDAGDLTVEELLVWTRFFRTR